MLEMEAHNINDLVTSYPQKDLEDTIKNPIGWLDITDYHSRNAGNAPL